MLIYRKQEKTPKQSIRISFCVFICLVSEKIFEKKREMAAEEGQVIGCHTVEAWNEQLQKGNENKKLVCHLSSFFLFFQFIINFIFLFGLYMFWIWLLFVVLGDWGCIYFGFWLMGLVWFGLFLSDLISLIWIIDDGICVGNLVLVGPFI